MSYVLDALRKAESERERDRGQVPGLHAQPLPPIDTEAGRRGVSPALAAGIGAAAMLAVAAAVWLMMKPEAAVAPAITAAAPDTAVTPQPVPAPAAAPPMRAAAATRPAATAAPKKRPSAASAASAATPAATPSSSPPTTDVAAASPGARVPSMAELPDAIRRELPKLAIGGSMYSDDPAARLLIIGGQPYRERDRVAPNLVLEQIQPKAAILDYKGTRFRLPF